MPGPRAFFGDCVASASTHVTYHDAIHSFFSHRTMPHVTGPRVAPLQKEGRVIVSQGTDAPSLLEVLLVVGFVEPPEE